MAATSHHSFADRVGSAPSSTSCGPARELEHRRSELTADSVVVFGNGAFQRLLLAFAQVAIFVSKAQTSVQMLTAKSFRYWCRAPSEYSYMSTAKWFHSGIPQRPDGSYSHCTRYERPRVLGSEPSFSEVPCQHWYYNLTADGYTAVEEWDLVCDRVWLLEIANAVFMCGSVVCVPIMGLASDRYGRRPVLYASVAVLYGSSVFQCFTTSLSTYVGLGFLLLASCSVLELTTSILLFESTPIVTREEFVALAVCVPTALAPVYRSAVGLFADQWRTMHLAVAAPSLLLIIVVYLTGESLDWLIACGKFEEAERAALWAAELNHEEPDHVKERLAAFTSGGPLGSGRLLRPGRPGFHALFSGPRRYVFFATFACWFTSYIGRFSLPFDQVGVQIGEFKWTGFVLNLLGMTSSYFITKGCGYFGPLVVSSLLCASAVAAQLILSVYHMLVLSVWALTVSFVFFNMTYVFLCIHTVEIFPTRMRSMGFAFSYMCGSLGAVTAALVQHMERMLPHSLKLLPRGLSSLAIACCYLGLFLVPTNVKEESTDGLKEAALGRKRSSSHISLSDDTERRRAAMRFGDDFAAPKGSERDAGVPRV
ncbi:solute carrier family 22 member 8 [Rhipicephalus sanguineus]|uniref:Uncharacterized protein n=1 Tax=Rhipicephalus sanguineus TaxID=34632 RepID=A0A9D4PEW2_RHISA|nr:solute carrier family 22 member 8 [Rhipicephalus sanguineus]KAH7938787.1 hypothetical protein HPB52_000322 [Rhipicephalus sanguineus]